MALIVGLSPLFWLVPVVQAATLTGGSVSLSDSRPSQSSVSYTATWSNVTATNIKCVKMVFSTAATGGSVPTGMNTSSSAAVSASSTYVANLNTWSLNKTTNGTLLITDEGTHSGSNGTVIITGVTNGSTVDTQYFIQFSTYNNIDCSSSAVDSGNITFIYTTGQAVSLTVDPSISFSIALVASGQTVNVATTNVATTTTTIPLGTVTSSTNAIAAHDLTVTTNAGTGYTIYAKYTAVPTSGSNTIDDHTGTNASPTAFPAAGTEAFGYTTNDATLGVGTADRFTSSGGNKWAKFTTSNLEVAYNAVAVSSQTTRVGYEVGIAGTTEAGSYTTTVVLTATPTY